MTIRPDRLALFGAVLVLLAGYLAMFRPAEAAIADRYAQLDDGRALLDRHRVRDTGAARTRDEERALAIWIRRSGLQDAHATMVDRFLRTLAEAARLDGVRVTAVVADTSSALAIRTTNAASPVAFDEVPLSIAVRGTYGGVIGLVRDLDRGEIPARIGIEAVANADRTAIRSPELRATLRVTLLRLPDATTKATHDAD